MYIPKNIKRESFHPFLYPMVLYVTVVTRKETIKIIKLTSPIQIPVARQNVYLMIIFVFNYYLLCLCFYFILSCFVELL